MGRLDNAMRWPPVGSPAYAQREESLRNFDNSVNAVSFGFVATAVLISMFLVMAIFERFFRPPSPEGGRRRGDLESQMGLNGKLSHPSPKMSVYSRGVSVLMPGENMPTFIAHPAPVPCPPERPSRPLHRQSLSAHPPSSSNMSSPWEC